MCLMPEMEFTPSSMRLETSLSTLSGEAPGYFVMMETTGISTFGYISTGSHRYENIPRVTRTRHMTVANTGRLMDRSERIMALPFLQCGNENPVAVSNVKAAFHHVGFSRRQPLSDLHSPGPGLSGYYIPHLRTIVSDDHQTGFPIAHIPSGKSRPGHANHIPAHSRQDAAFDEKAPFECKGSIIHISNNSHGTVRLRNGGVYEHDGSRKNPVRPGVRCKLKRLPAPQSRHGGRRHRDGQLQYPVVDNMKKRNACSRFADKIADIDTTFGNDARYRSRQQSLAQMRPNLSEFRLRGPQACVSRFDPRHRRILLRPCIVEALLCCKPRLL